MVDEIIRFQPSAHDAAGRAPGRRVSSAPARGACDPGLRDRVLGRLIHTVGFLEVACAVLGRSGLPSEELPLDNDYGGNPGLLAMKPTIVKTFGLHGIGREHEPVLWAALGLLKI